MAGTTLHISHRFGTGWGGEESRKNGLGRNMVIIRKADSQDAASIAKVHVDSWRTTYKGMIPDRILDHLSYEQREQMWTHVLVNQKNNPVFVAEDDENRVVGFATGGKERSGTTIYRGELYALYVYEDVQRNGIGRELIRAVVNHLKEMQYNNMLAWVLKNNPALGFYEHMGGKKFSERMEEIEGAPMIEYAMVWDDLTEWD